MQLAVEKALQKETIDALARGIAEYQDFPKKGILFQDVAPLFTDAQMFQRLIGALVHHYKDADIDTIAGCEARGFIIGAALAKVLHKGFVPVRKFGKIPGATHTVSYSKEYGVDQFQISQSAIRPGARVLIVDDLLATGGTLKAAAELVAMAGGVPVEAAVVVELEELKGREQVSVPLFVMIKK